MVSYALTTIDNPYSPFTKFDEWNAFDQQKGYNTCAYLARVSCASDELSDVDNELEVIRAIEEIAMFNLNGMYKVVVPDDYDSIGFAKSFRVKLNA